MLLQTGAAGGDLNSAMSHPSTLLSPSPGAQKGKMLSIEVGPRVFVLRCFPLLRNVPALHVQQAEFVVCLAGIMGMSLVCSPEQ